jgi:hypothetical protein
MVLTLDIAVKVRPCLSVLPISIVALPKVRPCDLCIVIAQAVARGICVRFPREMGWIGIVFGFIGSQGGPV